MAKYSCFKCPSIGHNDTKRLTDSCPSCGLQYGFPLEYFPEQIGKYNILEPISRGYYGSVYKVEDALLGRNYVLKIIPKSIYELHKKDFIKESRDHADLSGNPHIVNIIGIEESVVEFKNGERIDCHISILEYVPGKVLKDILESQESIDAIRIAQIAIDLFKILDVLKSKRRNHNDLHPENIIVSEVAGNERRSGEIDNMIKVVAIDIGSLTIENKSGDSPDRHGDVHWVANYITRLSEKLLANPDQESDYNYRLASLLEDRAKILYPVSEHQRQPSPNEIIESIKSCFNQQTFPWEEPLKLLNFNDAYNAQTLDPWYVPSLLVDPNDQWLNMISGKGPLVITGMRGCGKTMMLRALQFHARASVAKGRYRDDVKEQIEVLKAGNYVGVYVSCNKLLDEIGKEATDPLHQPFTKMFVRFGIEAIKALRHLKSISEDEVNWDYYLNFVELYQLHLSNSDLLNNVNNEIQLEQQLLRIIYSLNKGESKYIISVNPANAFPVLAEAIRRSANIWKSSYVLFLLDDVSTRYLGEENIKSLLSSLIFQSEECAFKITSEVQTIELLLHSPGKVEKAKKGRDFDSFDLGAAVNQKIREKGGKKFVLDILSRRAKGNIKHPSKTPSEVLGDVGLNSIANNIVTRGVNKTIKKRIYHGVSALAGVCVGDIGDIINLYDLIIRHYDYDKRITPISSEIQNECFQDLCSIRLHEVNRRGSDYKDFALAFAEASHELLIRSSKDRSNRLRQYYSIYVRITTGDMEKQYEKIRKLLDAGIFVYSGGANTPRTLGNDNNPINQFKLTYRKLYGVSSLIGLTQGDRFELSGSALESWLDNPALGKEILMKNVGGASSNVDEEDFLDLRPEDQDIETSNTSVQTSLFNDSPIDQQAEHYNDKSIVSLIKEKVPQAKDITFDEMISEEYDMVITALGFEERTCASIDDLILLKTKKFLLIKYEEEGRSEEILKKFSDQNIDYDLVDFENIKTSFDSPKGKVLCDITGMSKSVIFNIARNVLKNNNELWVTHIKAFEYSPSDVEIEEALSEIKKDDDDFGKLDLVTNKVLKGEKGPYEIYNLLFSDTDESKRNILIGFCNSKYERLFEVLENRNFDTIQICEPSLKGAKGDLARTAANIIVKSHINSGIYSCNSDELLKCLLYLTEAYQKYYIDQNYNFEIALTGSKLQTLACAIMSASFKISHCWYVKPSKWDINSFSKGVGEKRYFKIKMK